MLHADNDLKKNLKFRMLLLRRKQTFENVINRCKKCNSTANHRDERNEKKVSKYLGDEGDRE